MVNINLEQAKAERQAIYEEITAARDSGAIVGNEEWLRAKLDEYDRLDKEITTAETPTSPGLEEGSLTGDVFGDLAAQYGIGVIGEKVDEVAQVNNIWTGYQASRSPLSAGTKAVDEAIEFSDRIGEMDDYTATEKGFKVGFNGASAVGADPVTAGIVGAVTANIGFVLNATGIGGSGKSKQQKLKDQYKNGLEEVGIIQSYGQLKKQMPDINVVGGPNVGSSTRLIKLADGSYFNFEETEHGAFKSDGSKKEVYAWDMVDEETKKAAFGNKREVNANLVDFTNSLDFWTSRGGDALATITFGKNTTDEGVLYTASTFTNAATSNTKDREWNEENFKTSMGNMRQFYRESGIENFAEAKAKSQQMLEAGLIDDATYGRHLEGYQLVFNENFDYANEFENGNREGRGIYAAKNKK